MRKSILFLIVLTSLACARGAAAEAPRGRLLELHSCELYAGGCIVSSEAPLGGRHMLRAWNFTGGTFGGVKLAGLQVAVLQSGSENLACPGSVADHAVVYLPQDASASQREALLSWAKAGLADPAGAQLQLRTVPMRFARTESGYAFSAGNAISVKTASLESCEKGGCGEALWYEPRTPTTAFAVAVDQSSRIAEPLLKLKWIDAGKRNIFLGSFGDPASAKNVFVTAADLCGPAGQWF